MSEEERASLRETIRADPARFGALVAECRARLRRMVEIRMDPRLRGRLDASDVVQDACAEAVSRLPDWLDGEDMPLHLWLRFLTGQKLLQLHRHHLGAEMRDPRREISLEGAVVPGAPDASSVTLASAIADSGALSPSGVAMRAEDADRLRAALETMKTESPAPPTSRRSRVP